MNIAKRWFWLNQSGAGAETIDIYASQTGSAGGDGSIGDPYDWDTAIATVTANQTIGLKRGDTFDITETSIPFSGVKITAYGSGAKPIIRGSTDVGGQSWTQEGSYYYTALATAPKWVYINGAEARQGESAWITITSAPSSTTRGANTTTLNAFNTVQSLIGAKVRFREQSYRLSYEYEITNYNTGTGVFTTSTISGAEVGYPFKLYGQKQFATTADDWWYDTSNARLYLRASSTPAGRDIRVVTEDYGLVIDGKDNVTVENVDMCQFFLAAIYVNLSDNLTLDTFDIHDIRSNAIYMEGNSLNATITNFTIEDCGNGIWFRGLQTALIDSFTISRMGLAGNLFWPFTSGSDVLTKTGGTGIIGADDQSETTKLPSNITISNGTLTDMGYNGISQYGPDWIYSNLYIDTYCKKFTDSGGISTFITDSISTELTSGTITNVIVKNGIGDISSITATVTNACSGIYIDNGSQDFVISNCICINNTYGIHINSGTGNITVDNCILALNRITELLFYKWAFLGSRFPDTDGMIVTNNTFVSINGVNHCINLVNYDLLDPFDNGGSINNNTYYNPYSTSIAAAGANLNTANTPYTFSGWKTKTGGDAASTERNSWLTDYGRYAASLEVQIQLNPSSSTSAYSLSGYNDIDGNALTTGNIAAWSGQLYVRQTQAYELSDTFTGANGTAITGRAPQVGPTPTNISGTPIISSNSLSSSSNGALYWDFNEDDFIVYVLSQTTDSSDNLATYFRVTDSSNRLLIVLASGTIELRQHNASASPTVLATASFSLALSTPYIFKIQLLGNRFILKYKNQQTTRTYLTDDNDWTTLIDYTGLSISTGTYPFGISHYTTKLHDFVLVEDQAYD